MTYSLRNTLVHFLYRVAAGGLWEDTHKGLKRTLCDGHDFDGSSLDLKIKRIPGLEIELLPDFRGDGDLSLAGECGLHSLRTVRICVRVSRRRERVPGNAAPASMRRQPVFPGAVLDEDGDAVGQWQGGFHDVEDFGDKLGLLVGVEVEDEFVVNLEEHFGLVRLA